ncbi:MAG TPA: alpha/beta hydrolase [Candidatus Acidoferrales bacterium]|nr:alpha/beta hydrolase [Candidatus Acidoferrales bacterium]
MADVGHGIKLHYLDVGTGQPVVFVHGSCTNYESWELMVGPFSQHGFRAISYSRRCSTPNNNPGDIRQDTIPNNTEDLAGLIEALGVKPAHIVGLSRGGEIALFFASKHQDMLRTLTLIEAPAAAPLGLDDPTSRSKLLLFFLTHPGTSMMMRGYLGRLKPALKALNSGDTTGAARALWDLAPRGPGTFDKFPESRKKRIVDNISELHIFDYPEIGMTSYRLTGDEIRKITVPTLIMRGENTESLYKQMNDGLAKFIPNSEQAIIPGSHASPLENPEAFNSTVMAFLEKNDSRNG